MTTVEVREGATPDSDALPAILLVDDDRSQREMYKLRLEREGYEVRLADTTDGALRALRSGRTDLVLLDIAMPESDGLSMLQAMLDLDPALPVIIHTAYPGYADDFRTWSACRYVVKSQDIAPLLSAIDSNLQQPATNADACTAGRARGAQCDSLAETGCALAPTPKAWAPVSAETGGQNREDECQ